MQLTFLIDDDTLSLNVDPSMTLEDLQALLETEINAPPANQIIYFHGRRLTEGKKTLSEYGIAGDEMLELRRTSAGDPDGAAWQGPSGSGGAAGGLASKNIANDIERMRLQVLGNPNAMAQLRATNPDLASAAEHSLERFADHMRQWQQHQQTAAEQLRQDRELLNSDPFDIEAQRRIEEHIRQERVYENMEHAMEYSPESFGRVTMLYVDVEVNGVAVKAFVDSGAQMTIMSPNCARETGIMRLIDTRFSGIARGVGTATILGRVHSAQLKLADLHLPCSFTIMEGKGVDLLFGLDMLKRHQAVIDLKYGVLRVGGKEVRFLSEWELPPEARGEGEVDGEGDVIVPDAGTGVPGVGLSAAGSSRIAGGQKFPGSFNILGQSPSTSQPSSSSTPPIPIPSAPTPSTAIYRTPPQPSALAGTDSTSRHPEASIATLVGLGASREQAVAMLDAADGSVEVAASLMF